MNPEKYLYGILVFIAIFIGGMLIINDSIVTYHLSPSTNSSFGRIYNETSNSELYNISQGMKKATLEGDVSSGSTSWETMTTGAYSAIRFLATSFSLTNDVVDAIASEIGIPTIFVSLAIIALTVGIVFGIIFIVFRVGKG